MKISRILYILVGLGTSFGLIYMIIDCAISLEYARSQSEYLHRKCELLAQIAGEALQGQPVNKVIGISGLNVVVKTEGDELWLDNLVFQIKNGRIIRLNLVKTCR